MNSSTTFVNASSSSSSGETDLNVLLANLSPKMIDGLYCFITIDSWTTKNIQPDVLQKFYEGAISTFKEEEGLSMLLAEELAKSEGFTYTGVFRGITLNVHSSLESVGLTAAVSTKLAENNISANVIAATFHDHIFVPESDAEIALTLLRNISVPPVQLGQRKKEESLSII